ncbi:ArsR/SmtB family transcription factor [Paenibacillus alginolyticus]|uniref:Metalloregulator ArsR/SmtB family transcription factor n=1 Tax=Paenibacillus alginolyticus TaxID=59839 RepID=A0ABT4G7R7_9BACL|nr:metalloregulator ArsR/SmtB family transcription factor [Paenibacillus alginolyticus]MCY9692217.1 metalloregulator ArsR/SmtB family transcription factor [Paenibacillus alginolyticus]MEC0145944.1 metalloregulator ArsR/SmtB family transcription factor [Paenibacillus alginolyticus]
MTLDQIATELKLLSDKNRLTILALLKDNELCVCEIVEILQTSQPNVSQHIRKLKDGGLIKEAKKGQWVYYSLSLVDKPHLNQLLEHANAEKEVKNHWPKNAKVHCE